MKTIRHSSVLNSTELVKQRNFEKNFLRIQCPINFPSRRESQEVNAEIVNIVL